MEKARGKEMARWRKGERKKRTQIQEGEAETNITEMEMKGKRGKGVKVLSETFFEAQNFPEILQSLLPNTKIYLQKFRHNYRTSKLDGIPAKNLQLTNKFMFEIQTNRYYMKKFAYENFSLYSKQWPNSFRCDFEQKITFLSARSSSTH